MASKSISNQKIQKNEFGKIPLPWASEASAEAQRNKMWENTHAYWLMSQSWHGVFSAEGDPIAPVTVGDALHDCNQIMESHHTSQRLFSHVSDLRDDIILYGSKKQKQREKKRSKEVLELARAIIL